MSDFFTFVKKSENPSLSFKRIGSDSGRLLPDVDKNPNTHYFLKLKETVSFKWFLDRYKTVKFLHNNTIAAKSISKTELIYETNRLQFCG